MASRRRRIWGMTFMFAMVVMMFGVSASAAWATSWWSAWNDYGNDYSNRAAVTIWDTGGVNAATQLWHVVPNVDGCGLNAKLYSGSNCIHATGMKYWWTMADAEGHIKLTTPKYYGYIPQAFGWGNSTTRGGAQWQTHQTSRHDYSD